MRSVVIGMGLSAVLAWGGVAMAQTPAPPSPGQQAYEKDEMRSAVHQLTPAERVHERAAAEGRARLNRIEYRHAMGVSLQRPTMHFDSLYRPAFYLAPWGVYGTCAVPYTVWLP
jgi:hypothetical protein